MSGVARGSCGNLTNQLHNETFVQVPLMAVIVVTIDRCPHTEVHEDDSQASLPWSLHKGGSSVEVVFRPAAG